MMVMVNYAIPVATLAVAAFVMCGCSKHDQAQATAQTTAARAEEAPAAPAKLESRDLGRQVVLTAEFRPYQEADVMARMAGSIQEIRVEVGDRVRKGDLLATIEIPAVAGDLRPAEAARQGLPFEVRHAQDELRRAEEAHEITHLSFQRLSAMAEKQPGLVAPQEIADAGRQDLAAEAQVAAARRALASAQQQAQGNAADERKVETALVEDTRVTAPFTGVITRRYADKGSIIQAGTQSAPVVRLAETSSLRLILSAPEGAPAMRIGQPVEVWVPALHRSFPGSVKRVADKPAPVTHTMDAEVDVPNPSLVLAPGMAAEVRMPAEARASRTGAAR